MAFALWAVQHYAFMNSYDNYSTDLPTSCSSHGGTVVSPTERLHIMNISRYYNVLLDSGCSLSLVPILFIISCSKNTSTVAPLWHVAANSTVVSQYLSLLNKCLMP